MSQTIHMVITNCGDGSNSIQWATDSAVIDQMEKLADEGDESYASGDGLQVKTLFFPDGFDLAYWLKLNSIHLTILEDLV